MNIGSGKRRILSTIGASAKRQLRKKASWHAPCFAGKSMARISALATSVPSHRLSQAEAAAAVAESMNLSSRKTAALRDIFQHSDVSTRFFALDSESLKDKRSLSETMEHYRIHAEQLSVEAARLCLDGARVQPEQIDLVITSSCTGMLLPSLSLLIARELGFRSNVRRMPITEAGCSGGAYALARAADYVRAFPEARVLVIAVELPSLTMQKHDQSNSNVIACALFGDGAAAVLVEGSFVEPSAENAGVEILDTHTEVFPDSLEDLGFDLREGGLHIVLSRLVPEIVAKNAPRVIDQFLGNSGLSTKDLSFFVLHPGGRKVLDALAQSLNLDRESTAISRDVLRTYGNQSSASVLFVLEQTLARSSRAGYGLLAAFGPGITMELCLLHRPAKSALGTLLLAEKELAS